MHKKDDLRPVAVFENGKEVKGYFHRYIYSMSGYYSETKVLVELTNGRLRYYDPFNVRFMDRSEGSNQIDDKEVTREVIRLKYNKIDKKED
ncbi:MAG: hypothetical protein RIC06_25690 [Cyclobacteriaceae bacterium]